MRTIIRVQHKIDGKGIWRSQTPKGRYRINKLSTFYDFCDRHCRFPIPYEDKSINRFTIANVEFCAFKTIEQLQEWVLPSELKECVSMGFKVLLLDVSECVEGEYQILYKKTDVIQTKDISNLFI